MLNLKHRILFCFLIVKFLHSFAISVRLIVNDFFHPLSNHSTFPSYSGTELYDPERGGFVDLGILDVLQVCAYALLYIAILMTF